ncbi:hypothetical protein ACIRSU_00550 [Streptomyces sp. NPDC101160]|uniref:hypothetical protein n=1 Tax=Streptomyces sp. NPDC101160 TaxID=3366118 RepID=UPI003824A936
MDRKYLVLPAVLVVAAAVVAAVQLWPGKLEDLRAQNLCLGMLTEQTAGGLDDRRGGELTVDEHEPEAAKGDPVFSTICFVGRKAAKDTAYRTQYTLDVRATDVLDAPAAGAVPPGSGRSGWVGPRQSEVQLPAGCAQKMRTDAPYVTVVLKVAPGVVVARNWNDESLTEASRKIVLEAVDNLSRQYGCEA